MRYFLYTVVLALAAAFGFWLHKAFGEPKIVYETEVVYEDREVPVRDTTDAETPRQRRYYEPLPVEQPEPQVVVLECEAPVNFQPVGLIDANPIEFRGRDIVLTYFMSDSLRYVQDIYSMKPPKFSYGIDIGPVRSVMPTDQYGLGLRAGFRYKRIRVEAAPTWFADGSAEVRAALFFRFGKPP